MSAARSVRKDPEPWFSRLCVFGPCRFLFGGRQRAGSGSECSVLSDLETPEARAEPQHAEEHMPFDVVRDATKHRYSGDCSPVSTKAPSSRVGSSESLDLFSMDDALEPITVPLSPGLLFYGPKGTDDVDEEPPLLHAESLEFRTCGETRALGRLDSCEAATSSLEQTPAVMYSEVKDLIMDVRMQREDEPRLLHLIGALVHKGRIDRIFLSDSDCSSICCRVCRSGSRDGVHIISLEQAIKEMFEVERCRQNANLAKYQRQICSSMMRAQRARYLGLDQ